MGAISAHLLRKRLFHKYIPNHERLVITPLLDRDEQIADDAVAVDLALGCQFLVPRRTRVGCIDAILEDPETRTKFRYDEVYIPLGGDIVLHPNGFILGCTLEYLSLPGDMMGYVLSRSRWGRRGLIIATATGIHPLFCGVLTLELSNVGTTPVRLMPGMRVAQVFFHEVTEPSTTLKSLSKSRGSLGPSAQTLYGDEFEKLKKLRDVLGS